MAEKLRGYLVVKVLEAAGHNGDDVKVWDDSLNDIFVKSKSALYLCSPMQDIPNPLVALNLGDIHTQLCNSFGIQSRSEVVPALSRYEISIFNVLFIFSTVKLSPRHRSSLADPLPQPVDA